MNLTLGDGTQHSSQVLMVAGSRTVIQVFEGMNSIARGQKITIFSAAGLLHNNRSNFKKSSVIYRTELFLNLAMERSKDEVSTQGQIGDSPPEAAVKLARYARKVWQIWGW